jgi:hypothetical protein
LEALDDRIVPSQVGITVSSLADSGNGTLRAAILNADAGNQQDRFTIGFAVTGTIDLQSPLPDLNNSITIQGPGADKLTIERATGYSLSSAIIAVDVSQTASLSGLKVANGNNGGIRNFGTLTVTGCTLSGNIGSGILNRSVAAVTGSTFTDNSAYPGFLGGGILNVQGQMTVADSAFFGNFAPGDLPFAFGGVGGAIANFLAGATMTVQGCTLAGNHALEGGGIYNDSNATLTVTGSMLSGNFANEDGAPAFFKRGGGIAAEGALTVANCNFTDNSAVEGGAIWFNAAPPATVAVASLLVRNSAFTANQAMDGGAIWASAEVDVRGSTFSCNIASDSGGAIYNLGAATLQQCTLSGNTAGSNGGGIFNAASGTLSVKDSAVLHNLAPVGADIYNLGALSLDDSTVGVIDA